jgi:hypothetical protein
MKKSRPMAVPCQLSDVVKIGSVDQGEKSCANVITLGAVGGSLIRLEM